MSRLSKLLLFLSCLALCACGGKRETWSDKEFKTLDTELAEKLHELAGSPAKPQLIVWGREGKVLGSFHLQVETLKKLCDPDIVVVEVEPWGVAGDMLSVPGEALHGQLKENMVISLAGPLTGSLPENLNYVCVLPPQWVRTASFPGLRAALLPGSAGLENLEMPSSGSDLFQSQFRIVRIP